MKLEESFVWAVSVFAVSYFVFEALQDPPDPVFPRFYGSGRTGRSKPTTNAIRQYSHQPRFDSEVVARDAALAQEELWRRREEEQQMIHERAMAEYQAELDAYNSERGEYDRYYGELRELEAGLGQEMTGDGDYTDEYKKARKQLDDSYSYMAGAPIQRRFGPPYGPIVMWPPPPTVEEVGFIRWFKKHYPEHGKEP